jgi:hypothetical protein
MRHGASKVVCSRFDAGGVVAGLALELAGTEVVSGYARRVLVDAAWEPGAGGGGHGCRLRWSDARRWDDADDDVQEEEAEDRAWR